MSARPHAVVAGGSGRLGSAVAQRLLRTGHDVLVLDRVRPAFSDPALTYTEVDLVDETALAAVGPLHATPSVLVNCQGWSPKDATGAPIPPCDLSAHDFLHIVEVNLLSCFLTLSRFVPAMAAERRGRVINVSSTSAHTGRTTATAAYAAAKAGIDALTRVFAVRYGPANVIVCGVAPGKLDNPDWPDSPESVERYRLEIPLGRVGKCEDVAELIIFLASERNPYLTGQTVVIDGGRLA